jgi:hypothetical protein
MSRIPTVRMALPCPSCHVPQSLIAAFPANAQQGDGVAVLRECTRCWQRRARALNDARASLRRAGWLATAGPQLTWRGESLDDSHEHDGLQGALLSELLRRDVPASDGARLTLPEMVPAEEETGSRGR